MTAVMCTRTELAERVGVGTGTVRWWAKTGLLRGRPGPHPKNSPTTYDDSDVVLATILAAAHQLGPDQERQSRIVDDFHKLDLPDGWSGWLILTATGRIETAEDETLEMRLRSHGRSATTVIRYPQLR